MTTKRCKECNQEKERDGFPRAGRVCKACQVIYQRNRRRVIREAYLAAYPPQPKPIVTHKVCTMCSVDKPVEEFNWSSKKRNIRSTYCKPCQGKRSYADFLRRAEINPDEKLRNRCRQFGTTVEWYKQKFEEQGGKCAICGKGEIHPIRKGGKARNLAIDHDHITGEVRGLLCFHCNTAMERVESHGDGWLKRAVEYLKEKGDNNGDIPNSPSV